MSNSEIKEDIKIKIINKHIKDKLKQNDIENDKMILVLIFFHWLAASTLMAVSYNTYLFGFLNGAILVLIASITYKFYKGTVFSRMVFGIILLAFSAIFIQQHMGRIEIHFHIFIAIAFLTIYKDYFAAFAATIFIAMHHIIANILQENSAIIFDMPVYIFNYGCGFDIVFLHAAFVLLELGVVAYFNNINRQRFIEILKSEFKYIELSSSLEKEVKKRTAQYQSAKEDAESANRAKSTFLANMSHEIRTPLNAILGFVQILQENETDSEKSKYISTIRKSSDSLLDIINDILDFAKVESGKMDIDPILVNPHEDFDNIGALFFAKAEDLGINFHIYIDPYLPTKIVFDNLRVRQILTNLLSNAMKFSPKGGLVVLEINYKQKNSSIYFSVKDNGIGIAKENQNKIFEAFSQEENSTSRKYGGTGLGLAISAKLAVLMNSKLELFSEEGKGSEFYFEIKVDLPSEEDENFSIIPNMADINVALVCPKDHVEYEDILKKYLLSFGMKNIVHFDDFENVTPVKQKLLILNSDMFSINEIQSFANKGHSVIIIKSSLSQNFSNLFKGKVVVIDPPFTPSSVHDALLELFIDKTKEHTIIDSEVDFNRNASILIVEDNESNQYLMSVLMKKLSLKYEFANDGLEGIEKFKDTKYDLILMDENMPNMNGIEATKHILEIEEKNNLIHTPIISLTANAIKGDRERFLEAGMDEYLSKPINVDALVGMLKYFLPEKETVENSEEIEIKKEDVENMVDTVNDNEQNEVMTIESLAEKKGFDAEDIEALLEIFLSNIENTMQEMENAIKNNELEILFTSSHSIKGSSGNIGLDEIFKVSGLIESNARANNEYDYKSEFDKLKILIEKTKEIKAK